jgi:hypothetical protein
MRQVRSYVAFYRLTLERQYSIDIVFYLDFVLDNDSLVDYPLEIFIVSVEKLELNLVIESILECIIFLLISVDIIWCIP